MTAPDATTRQTPGVAKSETTEDEMKRRMETLEGASTRAPAGRFFSCATRPVCIS